LALVLFTALLYARSLGVPIQEWDDNIYLFRDARLDHLTWENLRRILTQPFFANFHPVTTLTFAFDRAFWGTSVPGFHVTHLAFYGGGVLGLYFLFARVLGSRPAALAAAAIYAAHTIHVESVAWLASRKDVVCLFFYAPALLAYIRYADEPKGRWLAYGSSLALAAAAMLSKGYAVILPAALFAYDVCFAGRITRRNLADKIPFLIVAGAVVLLTIHAQDRDSALTQSTIVGIKRVALLAKVFALYLGRTLLPIDLSAFYTIAREPVGSMGLLGLLLALALVAGFFYLRRRVPAAAFGIALYLLPLATVMNVFFTLRIWMADRYLFFPTIGSSLALVSLAMALYRRQPGPSRAARARPLRRALEALALLTVALYSALTLARIELWSNRVRLWSDAVRKELHLGGSGPVTANDLGRVTNIRSASSSPIVSLARAYEVAGNEVEAQRISGLLSGASGRGDLESEMTLARQDLDAGRPDEAVRRLQPIARGGSWLSPLATMWIGVAEDRMGQPEASRQTIRRGIELYRKAGQPATDGLLSVAAMEFNRGNYVQAASWYGLAVQESPREARPTFYLARSLEEGGKLPEALELYKRIASGERRIMAESRLTIFDVYVHMGIVAEKLGRPEEAITYYEEALRHSPDNPKREELLAGIAKLRTQAR
jgi:tetratricopeptide (TPR) repeat protein